MSQLVMNTNSGTFYLNVVTFRSPVYQQFQSGQTKTMAVHFPIKLVQPTVEFTVVFTSEAGYEAFQKAVRNHQQTAVTNPNLVTLFWPQRNINNWTGYIRNFEAGGKRFNFSPGASFEVDLVDSLVSSRSETGSIASNWQTIFGLGVPGLSVLGLPSAAEVANIISDTGVNILNGGTSGTGASVAASGSSAATAPVISTVPIAPTSLTNPGIVAGSG